MWGMIAKITCVAGKRDDMIALLTESAAKMPGCLSYVVAIDASSQDVVWVTEVWESQQDHDRSLTLRQVQNVLPRAKPLVANLERIATTTPVWGAELKV